MKAGIAFALVFATPIAVVSSCSSAPKPAPIGPPIQVVHTPIECLPGPPPVAQSIDIDGPEDGCPAEFEVCFRIDGAKNLFRYLTALQDYAEGAWNTCGKTLDEEN